MSNNRCSFCIRMRKPLQKGGKQKMITYKELSSLEEDLGFSRKALYSLSNRVDFHYREVLIPKGSGEFRKLNVPDDELKAVQRKIAEVILPLREISPYAAAYRPGGSPLRGALPHVGKKCMLKLDIRHFFDKITYAQVRKAAFPPWAFSEANSALLSSLCCFNDCLPQGAPSSPAISNIVMFDFDNTVGKWCGKRGISYTRYCDDLTFSGDFEPGEVKDFVASELRKLGFYLNEKKTVFVRDGQRMSVTGIVVNKKPGISSAYKRKLRQEMYYCTKFGIAEHLIVKGIRETEEAYLRKLLGRVSYVLSVEPDNREFAEYRNKLISSLSGYCQKP